MYSGPAQNWESVRSLFIHVKTPDRSYHRYKVDEAYRVREGKNPIDAYLDIEGIIEIAKRREEFHLLNQVVRANRQNEDYPLLSNQEELVEFEQERVVMMRTLRDYGFINWKERDIRKKLRTKDIMVFI